MQVLDLRSWTWSKIEAKVGADSTESTPPAKLTPCAGHSLVCVENSLLFLNLNDTIIYWFNLYLARVNSRIFFTW